MPAAPGSALKQHRGDEVHSRDDKRPQECRPESVDVKADVDLARKPGGKRKDGGVDDDGEQPERQYLQGTREKDQKRSQDGTRDQKDCRGGQQRLPAINVDTRHDRRRDGYRQHGDAPPYGDPKYPGDVRPFPLRLCRAPVADKDNTPHSQSISDSSQRPESSRAVIS